MKKVFFTVIGIVIGIALGSGIMYVINNDSKNSDKKENNNLNSAEEVEITDNLLKEDLTKKIYFMSVGGSSSSTDFSKDLFSIYFVVFDKYLYTNEGLTDDQKLEFALELTNFHDKSITDDGYVGSKKQTDVEETYLKYFGTKEFTHKSIRSCNEYLYDESNQVYYMYQLGCGGTGPLSYYLYMNNMTTKGNEAYVYLNAFAVGGDFDKNNNITYTIYKDVSETKVYKENITEEELNSFKIDSTNADNFDEYKFTFEKDETGNYYFKSIEKVR